MTTLTEFTLFSKLPAELRLLVWEHVPQPVRVVGYLPCSRCYSSLRGHERSRQQTRRSCAVERHPDWRPRYIVQPREQAIFPPLQACRESRAIWFPRYFRPPRYLNSQDFDPDDRGTDEYNMRFDVPFISYEMDIFTVFDVWTRADIVDNVVESAHDFPLFLGLDRKRIQHVAFCEVSERFLHAITGLGLPTLPNLRALSLLIAGPDPGLDDSQAYRWLEMPVVDIQYVECELQDIPSRTLLEHPFFGRHRPRNRFFELDPSVRPLHKYLTIFKAWLWHAQNWDPRHFHNTGEDPWWDFLEYVFSSDEDECPLEHLPGWDAGRHSKNEVLNWKPQFSLDCKLFCEKTWLAMLNALSIFQLEPTGLYQSFLQFKEAMIAQPIDLKV
jgi:2EXR family